MPITILDLLLLGVMLISGLLAMVRGFMREVLSIAAWATAAIVTLYSYAKPLPAAKAYINNDIAALLIVVVGIFICTLIVVSIITVRISDMILDSRIGALDRTLGFLFGLARGFLIIAVAFWLFSKAVEERQQPEWVKAAKSRVVLQKTGDGLEELFLQQGTENTISKLLKKAKPDDAQAGSDSSSSDGDGYSKSDRDGLTNQIKKPAVR